MIRFLLLTSLLLAPSVLGCGWFSYDDIEGTRAYYDIEDNLAGVEDSTLLVSRYPTNHELNKNVFIPMIYNG